MADLPSTGSPPTEFPHIPWLGPEYFENSRKFSPDQLAQNAGLYVAFSWQGDKILASGKDREEVIQKLLAAGFDPHRVIFSFVDNPQ